MKPYHVTVRERAIHLPRLSRFTVDSKRTGRPLLYSRGTDWPADLVTDPDCALRGYGLFLLQ